MHHPTCDFTCDFWQQVSALHQLLALCQPTDKQAINSVSKFRVMTINAIQDTGNGKEA